MLREHQPRNHLDTDTREREKDRRKGSGVDGHVRGDRSLAPASEMSRQTRGQEEHVRQREPPTHSSISRSGLFVWMVDLVCNEVPFYNSARDSFLSVISYPVQCTNNIL